MGTKGWQEQVAQWPGVESSVKWGDNLVFTVAGKMFCATRLDGPGQGSLSFKVEDDRFLELTERPGFIPAPYLARAHWVQVERPDRLPKAELHALLRRSYELVRLKLPKKHQRELAD
ncbi:MmcQ/YjbR family DNA-binding protein [Lysobacter sp.]|uniref:MmcQ/YjbR family DNA-binding protein n=1 Tax=Lysobacter sp. TaxID=72226 RepID=UPI002D280BBF|nr:MmcQ/YjbR family DNA-binding protein [Lysobacter sp.]HZX76534.1 MmcQ/YjbR family DNA-binding protein [Lysobacter sp.]